MRWIVNVKREESEDGREEIRGRKGRGRKENVK